MKIRAKVGIVYRKLRNYVYRPNPDATLLFGLNKSGTTVTINLLAHIAGKTFYDDFTNKLGDWEDVMTGKCSLNSYVHKHSYPFSKDFIRFPIEPQSMVKANSFFSLNKYIITIRKPADNIKSILSRLKIPGDLDELEVSEHNIHPMWMKMLTKKQNYIDSIIQCWLEAYDQPQFIDSEKSVLFKYEDFVTDKTGYIAQKVIELGYMQKKSIDHLIDVQYQPKGIRTSNLKFFGKHNFEKIIAKTGSIASKYGYDS